MINGPVFGASNAKAFLKNLKLLAPTTDRGEGLKKVLSAVLRGIEKVVEATGGESGTLKSLGGHPLTHILGETFFTQVPVLYGPYIAKFQLAPVSANLLALKGQVLDLHDHPHGIRDAVVAFFVDNDAEWELRVQLCTDLDTMPIEDASVAWPELQSPYVAVARITAPMQVTWDEGASPAVDDALSFSPWHGVVDHQPLGSVMRARQQAYAASAQFRGSHNGCPMHQPRSIDEAMAPR